MENLEKINQLKAELMMLEQQEVLKAQNEQLLKQLQTQQNINPVPVTPQETIANNFSQAPPQPQPPKGFINVRNAALEVYKVRDLDSKIHIGLIIGFVATAILALIIPMVSAAIGVIGAGACAFFMNVSKKEANRLKNQYYL